MVSLPPLPKIIGHRGARMHAPENTVAGLRRAAVLGAAWVEVDVKLTADGVPILMHDETLERTTNGRGAVRATDLDAIRRLDAGGWFAPAFAGEPVPTLEEALEVILELGLGVNLEIKPCPGREEETARGTLDLTRAIWPHDRPPPLISSFRTDSLETARRVAPDWPRGYLIDKRPADWRRTADRLEAATLNVNGARETAETIARYRETGRPVLAYTINDPRQARTLFDWGVSAVFTDTPAAMAAAIG